MEGAAPWSIRWASNFPEFVRPNDPFMGSGAFEMKGDFSHRIWSRCSGAPHLTAECWDVPSVTDGGCSNLSLHHAWIDEMPIGFDFMTLSHFRGRNALMRREAELRAFENATPEASINLRFRSIFKATSSVSRHRRPLAAAVPLPYLLSTYLPIRDTGTYGCPPI